MNMKTYKEQHIGRAEISQLILLYHLYSQSGSHDLIFQGGTALRWCYGGSRFSEDLDFVTPLDEKSLQRIIGKALKAAAREMIPHFGPGEMETVNKSTRSDTKKLFIHYQPTATRERVSVKLEFEGIKKDVSPDTKKLVLSSLPSISYLITRGDFKIPRPNAILVAETLEEILSDKIRALLERRYIKGRDIYDIWYLRTVLGVSVRKDQVEKKFDMYLWPFKTARKPSFFINPSDENRKELQTAIQNDLSRFLPPDVMNVHAEEGFRSFLHALELQFAELKEMGVSLP
jgi:predicted nucleotidyltransferase component of viral defense system